VLLLQYPSNRHAVSVKIVLHKSTDRHTPSPTATEANDLLCVDYITGLHSGTAPATNHIEVSFFNPSASVSISFADIIFS
jgi:hypothetical protein